MSTGVIRDLKGQIICLGVVLMESVATCQNLCVSRTPRLSNVKSPVNNKGFPIEFTEPSLLQEVAASTLITFETKKSSGSMLRPDI